MQGTGQKKAKNPLIVGTKSGLYCPQGDFYIDPWRPVEKALITHAHGDHARWGMKEYLAAECGLPMLRLRVGEDSNIKGVQYGEQIPIGKSLVSFHPAGHILGSAQIRIEAEDQVWVMSGDYKRDPDPTCELFEVVPCDTFITEATFSLPVYKWTSGEQVAGEILDWWNANRELGRTSILFCYVLGKAQRVLAELAKLTDRTVYVHGSMVGMTELYRHAGIKMLPIEKITDEHRKNDLAGELVIAPPSAYRSLWMKRFKNFETGFASGWMRVRAARRRSGYDRGFVISDHADWPQLLQTIKDTGASKILPTHGSTYSLVRYLQEHGWDAEALQTKYMGELLPGVSETQGHGGEEAVDYGEDHLAPDASPNGHQHDEPESAAEMINLEGS